MEHVCVDARFGFWDGKTKYTVEYSYGIATWFVFKDNETGGCLWFKKINPAKSKTPNRDRAAEILEEYLEKEKTKSLNHAK